MRFTESHEWIAVDGNVGVVGITDHAQKELGEVVFIELPKLGMLLTAAQEAAVLESTKAASDVYSPVSGKVIAVNESLRKECALLNRFPESQGWLFKIEIANPFELESLMDRAEYLQLVK